MGEESETFSRAQGQLIKPEPERDLNIRSLRPAEFQPQESTPSRRYRMHPIDPTQVINRLLEPPFPGSVVTSKAPTESHIECMGISVCSCKHRQ